METNQEPEVLDLHRRAQSLEQRDFQLWSIFVMVGLVLAAGLAALLLPNVVWGERTLLADGRFVPQLLFGFVVLVILFNIYILQQRYTLRNTREELMRELVQRQAAEKLSLIDPLTEVYNRRYLNEMIHKDLSRARRTGAALTFLMIDVDQFKDVNTRFGHLVGDRVLAEVAHVLRSSFRAADTILRYGGDEFLVVLEGSTEEQAPAAVRRLEKNVQQWNNRQLIPSYKMSLSCGAAAYEHGDDLHETIARADEKMYSVKAAAQ